jgi:hypothetical protein
MGRESPSANLGAFHQETKLPSTSAKAAQEQGESFMGNLEVSNNMARLLLALAGSRTRKGSGPINLKPETRRKSMGEVKYDPSHHVGSNAEARISNRLRNSGEGLNADTVVRKGDGQPEPSTTS